MEKFKILVVDDESRMRKLIRDFLEREGYQVLEASDGMEAMDIFYEQNNLYAFKQIFIEQFEFAVKEYF